MQPVEEVSVLMGRGLWLLEMVRSFPWKLLTVPVLAAAICQENIPMRMGPGHSLFLLRAHSDLRRRPFLLEEDRGGNKELRKAKQKAVGVTAPLDTSMARPPGPPCLPCPTHQPPGPWT